MWSHRCKRIIWTHVPPIRDIVHFNDAGIDTALLISWEELTEEDQAAVLTFNKIILPYRCVGHSLQQAWNLKVTNPVMMPWDVPVPITRKENRGPHDELTVYFPMYDSQPQRIDQAIFGMMAKVLTATENTNIVVAVGRSWSLSSRRILKTLFKEFGSRITVIKQPDILKRLLLFAKADLTVWAPKFESLALVGLSSLCMGTPVISWDVRPQNEFLVAWKNAILVPAETTENWLGVPAVTSGYSEFADVLVATLRDKGLIAKMKEHTRNGLDCRRKQFEAGWKELNR